MFSVRQKRIEEDARKAEEERAARERDEAHRAKVMEEAEVNLSREMGADLDRYHAMVVVELIADGKVPPIYIKF